MKNNKRHLKKEEERKIKQTNILFFSFLKVWIFHIVHYFLLVDSDLTLAYHILFRVFKQKSIYQVIFVWTNKKAALLLLEIRLRLHVVFWFKVFYDLLPSCYLLCCLVSWKQSRAAHSTGQTSFNCNLKRKNFFFFLLSFFLLSLPLSASLIKREEKKDCRFAYLKTVLSGNVISDNSVG